MKGAYINHLGGMMETSEQEFTAFYEWGLCLAPGGVQPQGGV